MKARIMAIRVFTEQVSCIKFVFQESVSLAVNYTEVQGTVIPCPKGTLRQILRI